MATRTKKTVEAAGGVVWRASERGVEVLLIHRPAYDDWSLPKGKLERGERHDEAALREVVEETGFTCELGVELGTVTYRDRKNRRKRVRYWAMQVVKGRFAPNREVDRIRWVAPQRAPRILSYQRDVEIVASLSEVVVTR